MYKFVLMELIITVTCIENFQGYDCSQCVPGFTGPDCQLIDHCVGVTCSGNGQCVDEVDSFNCSCDPGFTGEVCQTNIDDCVGVRCSGNGECLDGVNSFTCKCSPIFTGQLCDTQGITLASIHNYTHVGSITLVPDLPAFMQTFIRSYVFTIRKVGRY